MRYVGQGNERIGRGKKWRRTFNLVVNLIQQGIFLAGPAWAAKRGEEEGLGGMEGGDWEGEGWGGVVGRSCGGGKGGEV